MSLSAFIGIHTFKKCESALMVGVSAGAVEEGLLHNARSLASAGASTLPWSPSLPSSRSSARPSAQVGVNAVAGDSPFLGSSSSLSQVVSLGDSRVLSLKAGEHAVLANGTCMLTVESTWVPLNRASGPGRS